MKLKSVVAADIRRPLLAGMLPAVMILTTMSCSSTEEESKLLLNEADSQTIVLAIGGMV